MAGLPILNNGHSISPRYGMSVFASRASEIKHANAKNQQPAHYCPLLPKGTSEAEGLENKEKGDPSLENRVGVNLTHPPHGYFPLAKGKNKCTDLLNCTIEQLVAVLSHFLPRHSISSRYGMSVKAAPTKGLFVSTSFYPPENNRFHSKIFSASHPKYTATKQGL
ncbi:MAG: hypothetical protein P4L28_12180 [Paludibacteraceae bacterium]|nr:hypothetical protein [Paludibacteraceae bacterium]